MLWGKMKLLVTVLGTELGKISQDLEAEKSGKQVVGVVVVQVLEIARQKE